MEVSSMVIAFILGAIAGIIGMGAAMAKQERGFMHQIKAEIKRREDAVERYNDHSTAYTTMNIELRKAIIQVIRSSPNRTAYLLEQSFDEADRSAIALFVDDLISKKEDEAINTKTKTEDRDSRTARDCRTDEREA